MVEARYILSLRGLPDGEFDIVYTLDDSFLAAIELSLDHKSRRQHREV